MTIHLARALFRIYLQVSPFVPVGLPLRAGSASGTVEERRAQTRRDIVVGFDGDALILLQGVDGFEDSEALAYGTNTQILEFVVMESSKNISCDGVFLDLGFVLREAEGLEEEVDVVFCIVEEARFWVYHRCHPHPECLLSSAETTLEGGLEE